MPPRALVPTLLAAGAFALAGCGGDDGDDQSSGGSSEDPAEEIIADAGLEVCGEEQQQVAQSVVGTDYQGFRAFTVAKDCGGAESAPDAIWVFAYSDPATVQQAATVISAAYPRSVVMTSGALVIVTTGPTCEANADAVGQAYADSTGAPVTTT